MSSAQGYAAARRISITAEVMRGAESIVGGRGMSHGRFGKKRACRRPVSFRGEYDVAANAKPGSITVATAGVGTGQHLMAAAFMKAAGVKFLEVPYKGSPPAFTDLLAGRIDLFFDSIAAGLPYVRSEQARGIAVLSSKCSTLAPNVPTMSEAGVPGLDVDSWLGIFVPAKSPPEATARLRKEIRASLLDLRERFEKSGGEVWDLPDDKLNAFVASEYENWTKLIREAGIRLN
jgi:tripartite-type tricarboxylate transporter receptor subunit TctC